VTDKSIETLIVQVPQPGLRSNCLRYDATDGQTTTRHTQKITKIAKIVALKKWATSQRYSTQKIDPIPEKNTRAAFYATPVKHLDSDFQKI
jgi:hypothetical protein